MPTIQVGSFTTLTANVQFTGSTYWFGPEASSANTLVYNSSSSQTYSLARDSSTTPGYSLTFQSTVSYPTVGQYNIKATIYGGTSNVPNTTCSSDISGSGGPPSGSSGIPSSSGGLTVQYEPYFSVQGGDVLSGVSSTSISSNYDNSAGIYSWNQSGQGAGTTVAALATSNINQFVSGQSQGLTGLDPLTFANNTSPPYGGNYGTGGTSGTLDYYSLIKNMPGSIACPGSIGPMTLSPGTIYRCYTTSNITIAGDITASIPSNTPPSQFPVFEIVTKGGNVTIANNVHNLFGTYIAEINGSGGTISDTPNNTINIPSCLSNSTCSGQRLIINGSFIANQIYLLRAYGTQNDNIPAEQFNYQPINWLTQGNTKQLYVQSISSLPPVL